MICTNLTTHRKKLIINADDFGLCSSVNEGIIECLLDGKVTDLSFMVNFQTFDESVDRLESIGKNCVGIHINLTAGRSILNPLVSPLTDADGFFHDLKTLTQKIILNQITQGAIYREIKAQFEVLLNSGLFINHIDSHRNIHLLPGIMCPLLNVLDDLRLKTTIRLPAEVMGSMLRARSRNVVRLLILKLLTLNCSFRTGYHNTITSVGGNFFNNTNPDNEFRNILQVIDKSCSGAFEFPVHPGYHSSELMRYDTYGQQRERELKFLKSNNDFDLTKVGIDLVSFNELFSDIP